MERGKFIVDNRVGTIRIFVVVIISPIEFSTNDEAKM
jgi:hypothetical protein